MGCCGLPQGLAHQCPTLCSHLQAKAAGVSPLSLPMGTESSEAGASRGCTQRQPFIVLPHFIYLLSVCAHACVRVCVHTRKSVLSTPTFDVPLSLLHRFRFSRTLTHLTPDLVLAQVGPDTPLDFVTP